MGIVLARIDQRLIHVLWSPIGQATPKLKD